MRELFDEGVCAAEVCGALDFGGVFEVRGVAEADVFADLQRELADEKSLEGCIRTESGKMV